MHAISKGHAAISDLEVCVVVRLFGRPYAFGTICISPLSDQREPGSDPEPSSRLQGVCPRFKMRLQTPRTRQNPGAVPDLA